MSQVNVTVTSEFNAQREISLHLDSRMTWLKRWWSKVKGMVTSQNKNEKRIHMLIMTKMCDVNRNLSLRPRDQSLLFE